MGVIFVPPFDEVPSLEATARYQSFASSIFRGVMHQASKSQIGVRRASASISHRATVPQQSPKLAGNP
jgi:hypothetical protein